MRGVKSMLDIKAQLLIAAICVSATGTVSAETTDQTSPPAAAATETAVPKAEAVKKPYANKPQHMASSGRVGLVLGTAY